MFDLPIHIQSTDSITSESNPDFQEIFKVSIKQGDQNNELTPAQELLQSVAQQYMAGYSTSESKLSELKDGSKSFIQSLLLYILISYLSNFDFIS